MATIKGELRIADGDAMTIEVREAAAEARTLLEALVEIEEMLRDEVSRTHLHDYSENGHGQFEVMSDRQRYGVKYTVAWVTNGMGGVDPNHWVESGGSGGGETIEEAFKQARGLVEKRAAEERPFDPNLARLFVTLSFDAAGYDGFVRRFNGVLTDDERAGLRNARDEVEKVLMSVRRRGE